MVLYQEGLMLIVPLMIGNNKLWVPCTIAWMWCSSRQKSWVILLIQSTNGPNHICSQERLIITESSTTDRMANEKDQALCKERWHWCHQHFQQRKIKWPKYCYCRWRITHYGNWSILEKYDVSILSTVLVHSLCPYTNIFVGLAIGPAQAGTDVGLEIGWTVGPDISWGIGWGVHQGVDPKDGPGMGAGISPSVVPAISPIGVSQGQLWHQRVLETCL